MTDFGKSAPRGRRAAPRTQASLSVELSNATSKHPATLREISRTGAKLADICDLDADGEFEFRAGTVHTACVVVWSEGSECGIEFDIPLATAEVKRLRSLANFVTGVSALTR